MLIADRIQDPGNLGSIIRLAHAFACHAVILLKGSVDPLNEKVIRASMGAVFHIPLILCDEDRLIKLLAERDIPLLVTTTAISTAVWEIQEREAWALVIGNEGAGVSAGLTEAARQLLYIPMPGAAESLNAATACAITLYELNRCP